MRQGDEVEVLAPASLRDAVRQRLQQALRRYGATDPRDEARPALTSP
jgi:hypothetical protein